MKVLVTGGAGFIGSHLVDALIRKGHDVTVLDNLLYQVHNGKYPSYTNVDAFYLRGSVSNLLEVRKAVSEAEAIFHLAAQVGVGQSMYNASSYTNTNTMGTTFLMEEAIRRGRVQKIIVASSMSVYGEGAYYCFNCGANRYPKSRDATALKNKSWDHQCWKCKRELTSLPTSESKQVNPTSIYALNKYDQEKTALLLGEAFKIPVVALRYFNVYGPRQSLSNPYTGIAAIFGSRLLNDRAPQIFEDGNQVRDFVHVNDIVQANLLALENNDSNYSVFNIGTGLKTSVKDMAKALSRELGKDIEPEFTQTFRVGDIRACYANIQKAIDILGYNPTVRLKEGIGELAQWIRTQVSRDRLDQAMGELKEAGLIC
jgi:dTDP-L-rhamnose 4-epimerase